MGIPNMEPKIWWLPAFRRYRRKTRFLVPLRGKFSCDRQNGAIEKLTLPSDSPSSKVFKSTFSSYVPKMAAIQKPVHMPGRGSQKSRISGTVSLSGSRNGIPEVPGSSIIVTCSANTFLGLGSIRTSLPIFCTNLGWFARRRFDLTRFFGIFLCFSWPKTKGKRRKSGSNQNALTQTRLSWWRK